MSASTGKVTQIDHFVHQISYDARRRRAIFLEQSPQDRIKVVRGLSKYVLKDLVKRLPEESLLEVLAQLDPDEASEVLRAFSKSKQSKLIAKLNAQLQADVKLLLSFEPGTASQLVSLNYVFVESSESLADLARKIQLHERRTGKQPTVLVRDRQKLLGHVPGYVLSTARPHEKIALHYKSIPTLHHTATHKEVLRFFKRFPHSKAVVLGKNDNVLGIIYSDDIIRLLHEEESASLYHFAGIDTEESVYDSAWRKINFRYRWLLLNLMTAFLASSIVGMFSEVIAKEVLLAVYMPIVAGMGGNAGTQTLAVMVRALGYEDLQWRQIFAALRREVFSGLVNGLLNGTIVFGIIVLTQSKPLVGLVLGFAMVTNLVIAATFGTLVPVVVSKLGKDPASSATIFITTATDVFGFLAFLGLATMLLL